MIKLNWLLRQSQTFLFQYNKGAQRTSNSDAKLWTHRDEIGRKWVSNWRKLVLQVFLIFRYYLLCERDGDWRSLPRPQGLPQRRCHPLLLVHQHCQLWPDANCKILNISILLRMSNILHLPGPLWVQLHKSWGLWCGSDSDCIFQCRLGQSYHKTFCFFASNYFRSKLSFLSCRTKFNLGTIKLEYC